MNVIEHVLRIIALLFVERRKRVHEPLVVSCSEQTSLDTELLHGIGKSETVHQHADRANDTGLGNVYLFSRDGDVIAARCANVFDHCIDRYFRMQATQPADFIVDTGRLDRAAARAIDAQHHRLGAFGLECIIQTGDDIVGIRLGIRCDDAT